MAFRVTEDNYTDNLKGISTTGKYSFHFDWLKNSENIPLTVRLPMPTETWLANSVVSPGTEASGKIWFKALTQGPWEDFPLEVSCNTACLLLWHKYSLGLGETGKVRTNEASFCARDTPWWNTFLEEYSPTINIIRCTLETQNPSFWLCLTSHTEQTL